MTIQKLFTSRVKNTNGNTYVGETGRLFYDEQDGDFRLSDGHTPGGTIIFPDLVFGHGNISVYNALINGNLTVHGNTYTLNNINVNNISTTTNALSVTGNASFTGNTFFYGPVTDVGNLLVTGTATFTGIIANIVTKTSAYTITNLDYTILGNAFTGNFTVSLPVTPMVGTLYNIKKIDATANIVSVSGSGANIDGAPYANIKAQYNSLQIQWNGSGWYII